jgi:hypothetical protein
VNRLNCGGRGRGELLNKEPKKIYANSRKKVSGIINFTFN